MGGGEGKRGVCQKDVIILGEGELKLYNSLVQKTINVGVYS